MTLTRRRVVRCCGTAGVATIAGCLGSAGESIDPTTGESTIETTEINTDVDFRATLHLDTERVLFTASDIASIGAVSVSDRMGPTVPVELTSAGTSGVAETAEAVRLDETTRNAEIVVTLDGEELNRFGIAQSLAAEMVAGEWDGSFILTFESRTQAETFHDRLTDTTRPHARLHNQHDTRRKHHEGDSGEDQPKQVAVFHTRQWSRQCKTASVDRRNA